MPLTKLDHIDIAKDYLARLKYICSPLLDIQSGNTSFATSTEEACTLRDAIDHCEATLGDGYLESDQGAATDHLESEFAQIAHNLSPRNLKEAIGAFYGATQHMLCVARG